MTAQCTAINKAMDSKGFDATKLADKTGITKARIDSILSASTKPTQQEFNSIASALGISSGADHAKTVTS